MLRMHSSRKVVHRINRITISEDSHDKESEEVDNEESPLFQCGGCEYKTQNKETLMMHVEATHLLPKMLIMQNTPNSEEVTEELLIEDKLEIADDSTDSSDAGHVEERSCPTPIPDELLICAQCNVGFLSEEIFKEHEQSMHSETALLEKIRILEKQLYHEKSQHKNSMEEIKRLKSYNDTLEKMKVSLEAQIGQLQRDIPESVEENKVLKNIIEEKNKLIKKN